MRYTITEALVAALLLLVLTAELFWIFLPMQHTIGRSRSDLEAQMSRVTASEARQRMVLAEMPALVWTTDRQFTITSIGGGSLQDLGLAEAAIVGKAISGAFLAHGLQAGWIGALDWDGEAVMIACDDSRLARRILDVNRDQARETVVQNWDELDAAKAQIEATTAQVNAAEIALNGVREEARVGQRTTLDVLNAQQELVNARVALVTAQRDRVVASYTLLSAVGRLSVQVLGLPVSVYDPMIHYQQIRDSWIGVRTPDGR